MKHRSERSGPCSAARTAFPLNEVKAFFEGGAEVNRVWWRNTKTGRPLIGARR